MNNSQTNFRRGVRDGMPIALGYFAVAFTLGIAARNAGFSALQAMGLEEVSWFLDRFSTSFGLTLDGLQRG